MSNKPLNTYKYKGLKLVDWGSERFAVEKSFKRKDATEWETHKVTLYKSELLELRKLIDIALETPQVDPLDAFQNGQPEPADFDDDSIPF